MSIEADKMAWNRTYHPYPKYFLIHRLLRNRIQQDLRPGDRLPPEPNLSREFRVSRETLRQALALLEQEGFIERTKGRGTVVVQAARTTRAEKLTGFIEDLIALGVKTSAKVLSTGIISPPSEVAEKLGLPQGLQVVSIKRVRYVEDVPLAYHTFFFPLAIGARLLEEDLERCTILSVLRDKYGLPLVEKEQVIEAALADVEVAGDLQVEVGAPLLMLERFFVGAEQRPVGYFRSYYRADRYRYTVKLVQPPQADRTNDRLKGRKKGPVRSAADRRAARKKGQDG